MSVAESGLSEERYVIWDGDTILYRPLTFFEGDKLIFTIHGNEYEIPYFETNRRLIGVDRTSTGRKISAVSQHMPVEKKLFREMLHQIQSTLGTDWRSGIRRAIENRSGWALFSEYELFFDFVTAYRPHKMVECARRWYRGGSSCSPDQLHYLSWRASYVSFEEWDGSSRSLSHWLRTWRAILRIV